MDSHSHIVLNFQKSGYATESRAVAVRVIGEPIETLSVLNTPTTDKLIESYPFPSTKAELEILTDEEIKKLVKQNSSVRGRPRKTDFEAFNANKSPNSKTVTASTKTVKFDSDSDECYSNNSNAKENQDF